ncbi:MAG: sulfatase-like hydrolase/transferase [Planctomycetota bacterium]
MKILAILLFVLGLTSSAIAGDRPNVLILLADDLGYRDVGCYGGPVQTPNIDRLAAGGKRFEQFYSGCAVCSPSRATLLTGRHHIRTGVYSWINDESQRSHLRLREVTLAEILNDVGYDTAHIGKWHLGLPSKRFDKPTPDQHGFDYWFATWNNASPSHHNPDNFIRNGEPVGKLDGYSCQIVANEAIGWLDSRDDGTRPFFLNVWFHEPHAPIAAPEESVERYGKLKDKAAVYSGTIDNTDQAIGRLIEHLESTGQMESTLIIYASDNGSYRSDRVGGLRGRKGVNWEGGIRVPGIFHWPGHINVGEVLDEPAGLVDIVPTICGLLNLERPNRDDIPVHLDGSDLSDLLIGERATFVRHQPLFWHLQRSRPVVAMRSGDWSLVGHRDYELSNNNMFQESWIPRIKSGGYKDFELFNLGDDPGQTTNLASEHPELVNRLKSRLQVINQSIMSDAADWHQEDFVE